MTDEVEDFGVDQLEYRVKWNIGTKSAVTAWYMQGRSAVKKKVERLRQEKRAGIVVQARPVGEWLEPYDDKDLEVVFGITRPPPAWAAICPGPDERFSFAWGHASRFPGLMSGSPEHQEFVARCVAAIEAGDHLPEWRRIGGPL